MDDIAFKRLAEYLLRYGVEKGTIKLSDNKEEKQEKTAWKGDEHEKSIVCPAGSLLRLGGVGL